MHFNSIKYMAFLLLFQCIGAIEKFSNPKRKVFSIIVPCHYKHAPLLKELLEAYSKQSELPYEIIISLSEANKVSESLIHEIKFGSYPYQVTLLTHNHPVSEGGNRNYACDAAQGEILICQDADDLPHFQRVEIIKYFFENYNLDFLIHTFIFDPSKWASWYEPSAIKFSIPQYVNEGGPHANGAVSISKNLWKRMKWNVKFQKALDAEYNGAIYAAVPNRMLVDAPIYHYRNYLTSYED